MVEFVNHYTVLGLPPYGEGDDGVKINKEQIRKAYLCMALKLHPDKNHDDPNNAHERFRKLKTSYDILMDPNSKELFDNLLRDNKFEGQKSWKTRMDLESWNNIPEYEKEQPNKRTQADPKFWKKVLEEEEEDKEQPSTSKSESNRDTDAIRREKEKLRKFNEQVKEIRVAHANANAKKLENLERFVNNIPKANHKFTVRRNFSIAEFVSYEAKVLRRVQETAENYKRSSFSEPGLV